jgi:hypothetical protein
MQITNKIKVRQTKIYKNQFNKIILMNILKYAYNLINITHKANSKNSKNSSQ